MLKKLWEKIRGIFKKEEEFCEEELWEEFKRPLQIPQSVRIKRPGSSINDAGKFFKGKGSKNQLQGYRRSVKARVPVEEEEAG